MLNEQFEKDLEKVVQDCRTDSETVKVLALLYATRALTIIADNVSQIKIDGIKR